MTRYALLALTVLCALLARRSPAWRRLAWCLAALALLDVARLVTLPRAALRAWGWWQADVALVAMWPAVMVAALSAGAHGQLPRSRAVPGEHGQQNACAPRGEVTGAATSPATGAVRGRARGAFVGGETEISAVQGHPLNLTTLSLLCYACLLGIARPYLPAPLYLAGLVVPRVVLAGVWLAAVWRVATAPWKNEGPPAETESPAAGAHPRLGRAVALVGRGESSRAAFSGRDPCHADGDQSSPGSAKPTTPPTRLPALAALLLASGDVAAALVAWSPVLRGGRPAWEAAQGVTLASYGMVAAVLGWALRRRA